MSLKNSSDTIGNWTHDLPVCSIVPEPLRNCAPPWSDCYLGYVMRMLLSPCGILCVWVVLHIFRVLLVCSSSLLVYKHHTIITDCMSRWQLVFQMTSKTGTFLSFDIENTLHCGMWWGSWLRHCATSQKVAGSIPDGVTRIFSWHNPSSRTLALGSTQPLTEMSTRNTGVLISP